VWAAVALALGCATTSPAATPAAARARLQTLRARIAQMARENSRDAAERERLSAQLRSAELSLGAARAALQNTDQQLSEQSSQHEALTATRARAARQLVAARGALAAELRAAYLMRRQGPLQLLLSQRDPLGSERLMTYYGYVSRAAAAQIDIQAQALQRLQTLDTALSSQQSALEGLRQAQQGELQQLAQARASRQAVLTSLTLRAQTRAQQLAQLEHDRASLQQLVQSLGRKAAARPPAPSAAGPFGQLRGQLAWPVSGHVLAQFGQLRAGGVPWDGVLIATPQDTPVHAVAAGRVVYADWLPGLGLLVIVDHGGGYLSLYAHNDRLYKAVGASVSAGEVIAAAGDTGGRSQPQLLFEIRYAGKPINPVSWFRTPAPSP
jgi:septal ring factor EnvC (AmiA/AmiB activator)